MELEAVYLCEGWRTPIGRYGGALSGIRPDDLLADVLKYTVAQLPQLDQAAIDDCLIGCSIQAGEDNRNVARMATLLAGLPQSLPAVTVNRLCGSGLDTVAMGFRAIASGEMDCVLAGGVESQSRAPYVISKAQQPFGRDQQMFDSTMGWRFVNRQLQAQYGVDSMPETAENVAAEFGISRVDQDGFAYRSQRRAAESRDRLGLEIAPVSIFDRKGVETIVDQDEHPRTTRLEKLATLKALFREGGTVTAGNASGINDGAAVVVLANEDAVRKYGLTAKVRIVGSAVVGVEPRIMGIGPVPASQKLLSKIGWDSKDVDIWEVNEAFAAQSLAVLRGLGLPDDADFVNPHGGAIALGHPLGMSGTRLALSAAWSLQQNNLKRAVCTMCIGVGQGIALAMELV